MFAALGLLLLPDAVAQPASTHTGGVFPMHPMVEGVWVEKLVGDPEVPDAEFVIRIHHDPGYFVLPHTHPRTENITVLSGAWALGMGARLDRSKLVPMPQGALGVVAPKMAHFGYAKLETILQVHGIGPFLNLPVDPVFELSAHGILAKPSLLKPGVPTTAKPDCFKLRVGERIHGRMGAGTVAGALCSPSNLFTEYWITKVDGKRYWATLDELRPAS
ncbi:cupin domain-containing protein [Novosphingobium sp. Gsoil 351]|uniref:cupin domain-containing protein n=1 Tax=Novosphingobium sp. Gsoil 351 TaxID=2675225 RepID=UPI0018A80A46|nr:cupin domain-containing protein [Novosphingobium sp. Gsoil 351]